MQIPVGTKVIALCYGEVGSIGIVQLGSHPRPEISSFADCCLSCARLEPKVQGIKKDLQDFDFIDGKEICKNRLTQQQAA